MSVRLPDSIAEALRQDAVWASGILEAAAPSRDDDAGHHANRALVYLERIKERLYTASSQPDPLEDAARRFVAAYDDLGVAHSGPVKRQALERRTAALEDLRQALDT